MNIVSTVIVLILVIAVVCGIIHSIRKDRKKGVGICGGNCSKCKSCH